MGESSLKEKTAKGLFWGGFSNGAQQLLNLGFGIVLARLLDASDYGMIGMLAIFSAIAGTLQESGFTVALANKQKVSHEDYNAVFWFSTLTGVGIYILLFFCAPFIADFYNNPDLTPLARYVFLGFLISSTATAHNAYLFRKPDGKTEDNGTDTRIAVVGDGRRPHGIQRNVLLGHSHTNPDIYHCRESLILVLLSVETDLSH
ncbi:Polysaccharide biosynthesis protein [Bacteroides salyersiae]|nr:Polysaccharide biosynthesis protein [Bacteroides salyersiae]